eukprot:c1878_g1_i1.p1 GENE.c1878_g1_i1~~c1878_g1_i1.p1  ORF type:complete len:134 (-),score=31.60 c1878_g1_i1:585-986(-)
MDTIELSSDDGADQQTAPVEIRKFATRFSLATQKHKIFDTITPCATAIFPKGDKSKTWLWLSCPRPASEPPHIFQRSPSLHLKTFFVQLCPHAPASIVVTAGTHVIVRHLSLNSTTDCSCALNITIGSNHTYS